MNAAPRHIMVGVAGPEDSSAAVQYAVHEARRLDLPVHLVHVLHPMLAGPDGDEALVRHQPIWWEARRMLDDLADDVGRQLGASPAVSTSLIVGHVAPALVTAGQDAAVIVLQPERPGRRHLPTYSITAYVALHSRRPVVAVPSDWVAHPDPTQPLTVGLDAVDSSAHLLRTALEEARVRRTGLRILHTWSYSEIYDDLLFSEAAKRDRSTEMADDLRREVVAQVGGFADGFADVDLEVVVRHGRPADELVVESARSEILVVGRHWTGHRTSRHLGSVVRAVLHQARCAVMIVDPVDPMWVAEDHRAATRVAPA